MTDYDPLEGLDTDKLAEVALSMLALAIHEERRAWKGIAWDVMELLHRKLARALALRTIADQIEAGEIAEPNLDSVSFAA